MLLSVVLLVLLVKNTNNDGMSRLKINDSK
jgi:hypothetical protein